MDSLPTLVIQPKSTVSPSRCTGHRRFTVKPSRALKSTSGLNQEITSSKTFHDEGTPLLVSPALLRQRLMGQIDLSRIRKDREGWIIEIAEVKSSSIGRENFLRGQRARLFESANFLSGIFGHRSKLILLSGEESP